MDEKNRKTITGNITENRILEKGKQKYAADVIALAKEISED